MVQIKGANSVDFIFKFIKLKTYFSGGFSDLVVELMIKSQLTQ